MKELKLNKWIYLISALIVIGAILAFVIAAFVYNVDFLYGDDFFILILIGPAIIIFAICSMISFIRQTKDIAKLNKFRNKLGDDALFFEGLYVIEGQRAEDAKATKKSFLRSLPLAFITGIVVFKSHYHNPSRTFIVSNDKVYVIDRINMGCIYYDKASVKNAIVNEPSDDSVNVILNDGRLSFAFYTKKSEITNSELAQRLKNIFSVEHD